MPIQTEKASRLRASASRSVGQALLKPIPAAFAVGMTAVAALAWIGSYSL